MRLYIKVILMSMFFFVIFYPFLSFGRQLDQSAFKNYPHPEKINTDHTDRTWGKENNGLIAKIWTEKEEYTVGEPIVVHYIVKNITDKEIITWHSGFWSNHLIIIIMSDSKKITSQNLGLSFDPGGVRDKNAPWPIQPGEIDNALPSYDINKIFNINKSGIYSVQYLYEEYQGGWEGKLYSNTISFKVIERN